MTLARASAVVRSTCPYCGVGCGVLASRRADGSVGIVGDEAHPANFGRLCVKGAALGETVSLEGRLLQPMRRDRASGELTTISWDSALDQAAAKFRAIIDEHGPDAVAFYISGQLLTEDYYVANKLMKGYLGSANIDTNSRLCMSSAVAAHKRAFGSDTVALAYEDLELADLVVLVGSNTAWCHPVLWQRIAAARQRRPGMRVVVIDPRRTATCEEADLHLPLAPGTDVWLFNGLLSELARRDAIDHEYVLNHTSGAYEALRAARDGAASAERVARICGLDEAVLQQFYAWWTGTPRVVTAFSMGVNQSSAGTDKANAIINCHLLTGRIGKPGAGPFSITGQPNAMGGREVGGLSNQLAAHLDLANDSHRQLVQRFWDSPVIAARPGLMAVELFEAIHAGRVRAVWIIATNPVVSLPDADRVREALGRCELVIVSDVVASTDTAACADLLLPAAAWGEKDGTVTNSERRISRQRAFLPLPGEARPDWWALCEFARRLGHGAAFAFSSAHEVFLEHARLSAFHNCADTADGTPRDFDLSGLAGLTAEAYEALSPVQWPVVLDGDRPVGQARLFEQGRFFTADRRARLIALQPRPAVNRPDPQFPLVLNTGRVRDHWHTMTRTGRSPRLASHSAEPFVQLHRSDAAMHGIADAALVRVTTRWGTCLLRAQVGDAVRRGELFVPIHWNDHTASDARVGALVNPVVDPVSGEPEFKHTPARVEAVPTSWSGFVLSRRPLVADAALGWWTRIQGDGFLRYEIAGLDALVDAATAARRWLAADDTADWLEYADAAQAQYRAAYLVEDQLQAVLFLAHQRSTLPEPAWLSGLFAATVIDGDTRDALLAGRAPGSGASLDPGATVCSCFGVGRNTILQAVADGCRSPEALGERLRCGTNCGSCVPELRMIIAKAGANELAK